MKKIVFFDIDGTLLASDGKISRSTRLAVEALKAADILPVIATGRSPVLLEDIAKTLDIDSYISMNGQYIVIEGQRFYHNPIDQGDLADFVAAVKAYGDGLILCGSEQIFTGQSLDKDSKCYRILKKLSKVAPRKLQLSFIKRSMRKYPKAKDYKDKAVYQAILQAPTEREVYYIEKSPNLRFTRSNPIMFDVIKNGTSKATGIRRVAKHFGLDLADTYAFGDHLNDLEMLQYVGVGVAMGNAERETKEVANFITRPNDQDVIYHGLVEMSLIPDF